MKTWLVVPCFNEAGRWNSAYWSRLLENAGISWLFVDDGSTDATPAVLEDIRACLGDERVRVITQSRNRGKAEAVRTGLLHLLTKMESPAAVGFLDSDGAFLVEDVYRLTALQTSTTNDFDAVWSSRVALAGRQIKRSVVRHYISRSIATLVCWGDPTIPYDTQSGLKVFRPSPTLERVLRQPFRTRWMFELELLARWRQERRTHLRVWEEPLMQWSDVPGSHLRGRELIRVLRELAVVKSEQRSAQRRSADRS